MTEVPWDDPVPRYDRQGQPITFREWLAKFQDRKYAVVARDDLYGQTVSTVWLGTDHGFGRTPAPLLFETMIFPRGEYQERTPTEAAALAAHDQAVALVRGHRRAWCRATVAYATVGGLLIGMIGWSLTGNPFDVVAGLLGAALPVPFLLWAYRIRAGARAVRTWWIRPRRGWVRRTNGTETPVRFRRSVNDPTEFIACTQDGTEVELAPGDVLAVDRIGPGQSVRIDTRRDGTADGIA